MLVHYNNAKLRPTDRAMLDFAVRATTKPSSLTRHDVAKVHRAGFDDQEVLSIVLVTCLVNFMSRLADCLGVDVPEGYQNAMKQWLAEPAAHQPWLLKPVDQWDRELGPSGEGSEFSQRQESPPLDHNGAGLSNGHDQWDNGGPGESMFGELPMSPPSGGATNGHDSGLGGGLLDDLWPSLGSPREETDPGELTPPDEILVDEILDPESGDLQYLETPVDEEPGDLAQEIPLEIPPEAPPFDSLEKTPEDSVGVSIEPSLEIDSDALTAEPDHTSLDPVLGVDDQHLAPGQPAPGQPGFGLPVPQPSASGDTHDSRDDQQTAEDPREDPREAPSGQVDDMTETTTTPAEDWDAQTNETADLDERGSSLVPDHPVAKFVGQNCRVVDGEITGAKDLYIGYLRWCDDTGEPPMLQRSFGMALTQMGFNRRRRGRSRNWAWWGLCLSDGSQPVGGDKDLDD